MILPFWTERTVARAAVHVTRITPFSCYIGPGRSVSGV
jgi:hypothetical protein